MAMKAVLSVTQNITVKYLEYNKIRSWLLKILIAYHYTVWSIELIFSFTFLDTVFQSFLSDAEQ